MASKDPKIEAIDAFFAAYASYDLDQMRKVLADDIEWTIPGHHPLSGIKRGVEEVAAFFTSSARPGSRPTRGSWRPTTSTSSTSTAAGPPRASARSTPSGLLSGISTRTVRSTGWSTSRATSTRWTPSSGATIPSPRYPPGWRERGHACRSRPIDDRPCRDLAGGRYRRPAPEITIGDEAGVAALHCRLRADATAPHVARSRRRCARTSGSASPSAPRSMRCLIAVSQPRRIAPLAGRISRQ
jgi:hypothetical protein